MPNTFLSRRFLEQNRTIVPSVAALPTGAFALVTGGFSLGIAGQPPLAKPTKTPWISGNTDTVDAFLAVQFADILAQRAVPRSQSAISFRSSISLSDSGSTAVPSLLLRSR